MAGCSSGGWIQVQLLGISPPPPEYQSQGYPLFRERVREGDRERVRDRESERQRVSERDKEWEKVERDSEREKEGEEEEVKQSMISEVWIWPKSWIHTLYSSEDLSVNVPRLFCSRNSYGVCIYVFEQNLGEDHLKPCSPRQKQVYADANSAWSPHSRVTWWAHWEGAWRHTHDDSTRRLAKYSVLDLLLWLCLESETADDKIMVEWASLASATASSKSEAWSKSWSSRLQL